MTDAETAACSQLIEMALQEDLGPDISPNVDLTSSFVDPSGEGATVLVARKSGLLAGLPAAAMVFARIDPTLQFEPLILDGAALKPGDRIATITGLMVSILAAERTALNFLQHLSGIATMTNRYVATVSGCAAKILDTRKTIPGWRVLEKYAVRQGGGHNHRMGLYDMALVKDNHWAALADAKEMPEWIGKFRAQHPGLPIEVEVDRLEQLDLLLRLNPPDIILLDNMPLDVMREAVKRRNAVAPKVLLEASGGVTLETVRAIAETGVDRISVGALTHSAPALDIALDYEV